MDVPMFSRKTLCIPLDFVAYVSCKIVFSISDLSVEMDIRKMEYS